MQIVQVKLQNGVFVPLEPVEMTEDQEAVVILGEKRRQPVAGEVDYKKKAREYFIANFPGLEVEETVLELVGIVPQAKASLGRKEYQNYLKQKYND